MGIFTRVRDIVNSNVNAMLDKAENPEKLVKLIIHEMEDTLVDIKGACARVLADARQAERRLDEARRHAEAWRKRARTAVDKDRDDLARQALAEQKRHDRQVEAVEDELAQLNSIAAQYKADIITIEEKLATARERQRSLVQRHVQARRTEQARTQVRRYDSSAALARFEAFEHRVERMEASAGLVNYGRKPSLEDEFARLEHDGAIEQELQALKTEAGKVAPPAA